jgi:hypothetical protein
VSRYKYYLVILDDCSHNGHEFDNSHAHMFFLCHGVALCMSCPYTSQQNGKAEHSIRTINNSLCSLLFQASLPLAYWVEPLHSATYIMNHIPIKTLTSSTPYTALFLPSLPMITSKFLGVLAIPTLKDYEDTTLARKQKF